jgi:hypothetical protein
MITRASSTGPHILPMLPLICEHHTHCHVFWDETTGSFERKTLAVTQEMKVGTVHPFLKVVPSLQVVPSLHYGPDLFLATQQHPASLGTPPGSQAMPQVPFSNHPYRKQLFCIVACMPLFSKSLQPPVHESCSASGQFFARETST